MDAIDIEKVHAAVRNASTAGVEALVARNNGDTVEIHGKTSSLAAKQEAFRKITAQVGDAGLVNKIKVVAAAQVPLNPPAPGTAPVPSEIAEVHTHDSTQPTLRMHSVKKGETLSEIAQHYYGKASLYTKIYEANLDRLSDPDKIREGQLLRIP